MFFFSQPPAGIWKGGTTTRSSVVRLSLLIQCCRCLFFSLLRLDRTQEGVLLLHFSNYLFGAIMYTVLSHLSIPSRLTPGLHSALRAFLRRRRTGPGSRLAQEERTACLSLSLCLCELLGLLEGLVRTPRGPALVDLALEIGNDLGGFLGSKEGRTGDDDVRAWRVLDKTCVSLSLKPPF